MTDLALDTTTRGWAGGEIARGCPDCGEISLVPRHPAPAATLICPRCDRALERSGARGVEAGLALNAAALILMAPACLMPLLSTTALGATRVSRLIGLTGVMWRDRQPWLGLALGLFLVVFPIVRLGLLTAVLGRLRLARLAPGRSPRRSAPAWLGPAFRLAQALGPWAMVDVFLVALMIAYSRLATTISVGLGAGGYALAGVGLLMLLARAALDPAAVWEAIAPAADPGRLGPGALDCDACGEVQVPSRPGAACVRCGAHLHRRRPAALRRAAALSLAGLLLYIPANLYPIATLPIGLTPTRYTILQGVKDLMTAGFDGLALIVFTASFLIPCGKLLGLGWCTVSVLTRSRFALKSRSRLYTAIDEIGRWSMIDPFVIGAFVPV
ncbi:MAG: paraquat-inducible protein A, partial [Alphaproteobacteria bacterium]|nr:paraquat-inducible protein A [Alphaproteobacteria bacterium]